MRILVIEDEPAIADFLERGLKAEGYSVISASDGEEGEAILRAEDVALVILDVMLPGKSRAAALARSPRRAREVAWGRWRTRRSWRSASVR